MNLHKFTASNGIVIEFRALVYETKAFENGEHVFNSNITSANLDTGHVTSGAGIAPCNAFAVNTAYKEFMASQGFKEKTSNRKKNGKFTELRRESLSLDI